MARTFRRKQEWHEYRLVRRDWKADLPRGAWIDLDPHSNAGRKAIARTVARDDAPHVGQADAGAFKLFHGTQPLEHPEEFLDILHVEPDAVVADEQGDLVVLQGRMQKGEGRMMNERQGAILRTHLLRSVLPSSFCPSESSLPRASG